MDIFQLTHLRKQNSSSNYIQNRECYRSASYYIILIAVLFFLNREIKNVNECEHKMCSASETTDVAISVINTSY